MKLYGVAMVRNEGDILESWARYHLQLFDRLLVVDHASVDNTTDILKRLGQEGLPINRTRLDHAEYDQSRVMTDLARNAVSDGADWVFPLDGDEFLNVRESDPRRVLESWEHDSPVALPWQTYVPRHNHDSANSDILNRITWRLKDESQRYDKVAIPGEMLRNPSITIAQGSHALLDGDSRIRSTDGPHGWAIAHFPVRSVEQLARKAFVGWIASLAQPNLGPRTAHQWRKWFHFLIEQDLSELDPGPLAMSYLNESSEGGTDAELVLDPLPGLLCGFDLRYSNGQGIAPLKALALAAESQAEELAELRSKRT